jgi:HAD superfamily hydrolase (TIGR01509 family)
VTPRPSERSTKAVFFDVDFTLIHPGPTFQAEGYARFCAAEAVVIDAERFEEAVAAASFILDEIEEQVYDPQLFVHYTATIIEHMGGRGAGVIRAAERVYEEWAGNHHFEIYDDVAPVLTALAARGLILGAISNSHRSLDTFKEHFKLDSLLGPAISSAEHGFMKPHRSIFEAALAHAQVDASQAIMVGDSLRADIEGAVAVGMRGILLRRSGERPSVLPAGVSVITSLHDLLTPAGAASWGLGP